MRTDRRIRDALLRNGRPTRQMKLDKYSEQFSCDICDNDNCTQPRKTAFGKPRFWSYKGACAHYEGE